MLVFLTSFPLSPNLDLLGTLDSIGERGDVGKVFIDLSQLMKNHYTQFMQSYGPSMQVRADQDGNARLSAFFSERLQHEEVKGLDISSYMIMPIQRYGVPTL